MKIRYEDRVYNKMRVIIETYVVKDIDGLLKYLELDATHVRMIF